jgi:superfamily II DNA or RNA helicase
MNHFDYRNFLESKRDADLGAGHLDIECSEIHEALFPFQRDVVSHLLSCGRAAAFMDTGLGKTVTQCEFARQLSGEVLILAPLAVAQQTVAEAADKLGMPIGYSKDGSISERVMITNYERVGNFDPSRFEAVILDESSILKGQTSKTRKLLTDMFRDTRFKLACTATPAPNDYTEIGNHAEFLGVMNQQEMLMRWFLHDSANTQDWRLKGHAVKPFWQWVSSWAACVSKPSDLGYSDDGYDLPGLNIETVTVETRTNQGSEGSGLLFEMPDVNATSLHRKKRETVIERVAMVADRVNDEWSDGPVIVWCESNQESELLAKAIPDAVEVKGSDSPDVKEARLLAFTNGAARVLVSKPSICGFGMNWQHCQRMVFASVSYSYEKFYQAVRRCWRFGQLRPVDVMVVIADAEIPVWRAVERKATSHEEMKAHMKLAVFKGGESSGVKLDYLPDLEAKLPDWLFNAA